MSSSRKFMDLFSWEGWDEFGDRFEMYINCELLKNIGKFEKGTLFPSIYFDKKLLSLSFYEDEDGSKLVMEKKFTLSTS